MKRKTNLVPEAPVDGAVQQKKRQKKKKKPSKICEKNSVLIFIPLMKKKLKKLKLPM